MSTIKYLVEVDFESPLLSNSSYGMQLGAMRLITGDATESHFGESFIHGLIPVSNMKVPKSSFNMSAGGGVSVSASGSLSVSNMNDLYGFLQENNVYWTYKFCSIWSVIDGTPKLEFKGIISSGSISASMVTFTLGSRLNRDLRRIPEKINTGLFYGAKLGDKATESTVLWEKDANINVNQPEGSFASTSLYNITTSTQAFSDTASEYTTNFNIGKNVGAAASVDTLVVNSDNASFTDAFIGDFIYVSGGGGKGFLYPIIQSRHYNGLTGAQDGPKDILQIKPGISKVQGAFYATYSFAVGYSNNWSTPRTEIRSEIDDRIIGRNEGVDSIDIQNETYLGVGSSVTINEPLNPQIAELEAEALIYAPNYFLPSLSEHSKINLLSTPINFDMRLSDSPINELLTFNGIFPYTQFVQFTPGNNFVTYDPNALKQDFALECWQRLGSKNDETAHGATTRGLIGNGYSPTNSMSAVHVFQEYGIEDISNGDYVTDSSTQFGLIRNTTTNV